MQLYRRMTFNVLAGNRDDHLRNHGFLRHADGWRLAPAFDLNPAREMREHATAVNGKVASPDARDVLDVRSFFGLSEKAARAVIADVADAVGQWRAGRTRSAPTTSTSSRRSPTTLGQIMCARTSCSSTGG